MLAPVRAAAQDGAPTTVATTPTSPAESDTTPGRVTLEYLGALGGLGVSVGVMFAAAAAGDDGCHGDVCEGQDVGGIFAAGIVTALVAVPLGTFALGQAAGKDGSYWAAFGGHFAGALAGGALLGIASAIEPGEDVLTAVAILALAMEVTGSVVGFELSLGEEPPRRDAARRARWMATAAPMVGGVAIGLSGEL